MAELEVLVEGNKRIVRGSWRVPDDAGVLTDPTTVTFTARKRATGALPTAYVYLMAPEVTKVSTGIFELKFEPAEGTWAVHARGTGAADAAGEIQFIVSRAEALAT